MERLSKLLCEVKKRPSMFLGKASIEMLGVFINGYMICKRETDIHADFFPGFGEFIEDKYDKGGTDSFEIIIRSITTSDEEAFYKFFELLEEFQDKQSR